MDLQRVLAYILLCLSAVMIWTAWEADHAPKEPAKATQEISSPATTASHSEKGRAVTSIAPSIPNGKASATPTVDHTLDKGKIITIKTDVMEIQLNTQGGNLVQSKLLDYPEELNQKNNPFVFLNDKAQDTYLAQTGLVTAAGSDASPVFTASQSTYQLESGKEQLKVALNWVSPNGLKVTKIYTFYRGKYKVDFTYRLQNIAQQNWTGHMYAQLTRSDNPPTQGGFSRYTYFGAAVSSPDKHYKKVSFKDMGKSDLNQFVKGGWAAMLQHYFVSAWVPNAHDTFNYYSKVTNGLYTIGLMGPELTVSPGSIKEQSLELYSGPAIASKLDAVAPYLNLTIDYGWVWFISLALFWLMKHIYDVIGNWGWSIVLVTLSIKIVFYRLNAKSYRSMAQMRKLQPRIKILQKRFTDDKQALSKATMELYRKEKVNPLSGCLPLLVQIPVFIGLYWLIVESVQLRQAPFIFWIHDLAAKDPFYVLPVIMGVTMFIQQRLSPPPADPTQAKVMMLLPVVFTVFFLQFPAGLVLYWVVNNSLSILQQWYVMRTFSDTKKLPGKRKKG
jgi:YidC/Oxa1 family membrane protein insertase